jgi:TolB-like protein/DNA-binding SARP family transcriptional activator/Tfp pilus assembly protein PilF
MAPPTHRLRVLGVLDLRAADGAELRAVLAQPRRFALLAYLALTARAGPQRRDGLLTLFWPDQDEAHARNALSQAVHFLRRSLGAYAIVGRTDDDLALATGVVWCDALAFEDAAASNALAEAAELYQGELLPGFHFAGETTQFASWLEQRRAELSGRYSQVLDRLSRAAEKAGDSAAAVAWRRRLAGQDPLNAEAALGLMRALVAAGNTAGAIRHARVHEALLRNELDAAPDARIIAYVRELQAPQPELPRAASLDAPSPVPGGVAPTAEHVRSAKTNLEPALPAPKRPWPWRRITAVGALMASAIVLGAVVVARARPSHDGRACVAVIPLANYTGDRTQDDYARAITDAVLTELARYERLSVISRTSITRYEGTKKPLAEIAGELACDHLVEGSVTRNGDHVLVNAQLVEADDHHLWADRYDVEERQLPEVERSIAEAVVLQLEPEGVSPLKPEGQSAVPLRRADPIVYGIYLRGRDALLSRDPAGVRHAIELFKQAIARDSGFAPAYAGLADAYRFGGGLGYMPESFVFDSAPAIARQAVALDPDLSEAHVALGGTLTDAADWPAAEREFRRAIELSPSNALAHHWFAALLITLDRKQEAVREIRRARDLDPLSQAARGLQGEIERYAGVRSQGGGPLPRTALVDPNHVGTAAARSVNLARAGRCPEAYAENDRAQKLAPDDKTVLISLVGVRLFCGDSAGALSLLHDVEQRPEVEVQGVYVAAVFAKLGENDSAFAWLDRTHYGMVNRMELRIMPQLAPLRRDPRFDQLLRNQHMR